MGTGKKPLFFFEIVGRLTIKACALLGTIIYLIGNATFKLLLPLFSIRILPAKKRKKGRPKKSYFLKFFPLFHKKALQLIKVLRSFFLYPIKLPSVFFKKINLPKIKRATLLRISLFSFLFFFLLFFYLSILKDLPRPHKLITREQIISTKIYDREGRLLYKIYRAQNRSLVKLEELPAYLVQATIAIEDKDFYQHQGFSLRGIFRALKNYLFENEIQGGSTITQQLVKNALLSPEQTIRRKIKEIILAIQVETYFSKEEILQMYFNEVPYGGTAYGVEEASQTYFGKSARELTLAEAVLLAGLPAAPTRFSPFGAHPHLAVIRQHEVFRQMVKEGYLSPLAAEAAKSEKLTFISPRNNIKAPHFVMFVKDLLAQKYGIRMVEEGGLEVITSLDLDIQEKAQEIVRDQIANLKGYHITNGAALVTKPETGEILAMVGSRSYFDKAIDGNVNVTIMPRQPGSAIKVVNYAYALQNGYTPATVIQDTPITYRIPGSRPYSPVNYDNSFHGPVTLRTALASSYNVPAVKVLSSYGVDKMLDMGKKLGITTWQDRSRFGLSLTLGGGEVKMTEMTVVYGILANQGIKVELAPVLEVKDYKGKVLEKLEIGKERVLDPEITYLLTDILKDNQARTPAFGPNSALVIPGNEVAVKTGTTSNKRDNWTIGYTKDFLAAVWVGNNDNSPMSHVASGVTGASPIWHQIMLWLLKDKESHHFSQPTGLVKVSVCSLNGLLPCEGCPTKEEYFLPGTAPTQHCKMEKEEEKRDKDKILEGVSIER